MSLSKVFFLLQQEGYIIRSCLTNGLTALRNADLESRGTYYTAFFQLSIGLERMMKVTLILDYMTENQLRLPDNNQTKKYSHNLLKLLDEIKNVADKRNIILINPISPSSIEYTIMEFLDLFAQRSRYANLDALSGKSTNDDPLSSWNKIIALIIHDNVSVSTQRRIIQESNFVEGIVDDAIKILYHDLENNSLSLNRALTEVRLHNLAAPYAVWHTMQIIAYLEHIMTKISDTAQRLNQELDSSVTHIPTMREFFDYVWLDKKWIKNKKKWP
jgi:hypothetical protein